MLPADHRMRRSADFATAFKGARGGANRVLVSIETTPAEPQADLHPVKVGFVVPKSVGNSVVRHRVYRQLRHLVRERLEQFPGGALVAVRALPPAKGATSAQLAKDLDVALAKAQRKIARRDAQRAESQGEAISAGDKATDSEGVAGEATGSGATASKATASEATASEGAADQ
ncbi:MAG: ribonuclease P protein component [Ancrocorticia sp.]